MTKEVDEFCAWARPCNGTYLNPSAFNAMEVWRAAQAAVAARAPVAQWISVTDRLPENSLPALIWPHPREGHITAFHNPGWGWYYVVHEDEYQCIVTHWMPLLTPPAPADAKEAP